MQAQCAAPEHGHGDWHALLSASTACRYSFRAPEHITMLNRHIVDVICNNATLTFDYLDAPHFVLGPFSSLTLHSCIIETPPVPQPDPNPLNPASTDDPAPAAKAAGVYDNAPERVLGYWAQAPMPSLPATLLMLDGRVYSTCQV